MNETHHIGHTLCILYCAQNVQFYCTLITSLLRNAIEPDFSNRTFQTDMDSDVAEPRWVSGQIWSGRPVRGGRERVSSC